MKKSIIFVKDIPKQEPWPIPLEEDRGLTERVFCIFRGVEQASQLKKAIRSPSLEWVTAFAEEISLLAFAGQGRVCLHNSKLYKPNPDSAWARLVFQALPTIFEDRDSFVRFLRESPSNLMHATFLFESEKESDRISAQASFGFFSDIVGLCVSCTREFDSHLWESFSKWGSAEAVSYSVEVVRGLTSATDGES